MATMNSAAEIQVKDVLQLQRLLVEKDCLIAEQAQRIAQQQSQIAGLFEQFRIFRHRQFGPSSEQGSEQPWLFNEAEQLAAEEACDLAKDAEAATEKAKNVPPTARGGRQSLPPELPRVDVVHQLPEHEQQCACGGTLRVIGEEISEQIDKVPQRGLSIIPAKVRVLRHIRKKYVCQHCESAPVTAALPPQPIPKSNASPGLIAYIAIAKYQDGMPLHRLESKPLARIGLDLPRQTQARWMIRLGTALLRPLHNLLWDEMRSGDVVHYDETTVQVLKEPDKPPTSTSQMWVAAGGRPDKDVILFDYHSTRSGQVPVERLSGYRGYVMTDGYRGYDALAAEDGIEHLCCWQHARHRFKEAKLAQPAIKGPGPSKVSKADVAINFIGKLYGIERRIQEDDVATRYQVRQRQSVPVLQQLRTWLDKTVVGVLPSGKLGDALQYLDKYWAKLVRYTERGDLPIDNNRVERAIRPFVIGRVSWLFCDTPNGAHASAVIYSIIETAKANGLEPYSYLRFILKRLPAATCVEDFEKLLPWNIDRDALITDLLC
jgi:transposase